MTKDIWNGNVKEDKRKKSVVGKIKYIIEQFRFERPGSPKKTWNKFKSFVESEEETANKVLEHLNANALRTKYRFKPLQEDEN